MAIVKSKGTLLKVDIASVDTTVAQVFEMSLPEEDPETFDGRTLDQSDALVPNTATGYVTVGDATFGLFFDPSHASHAPLFGTPDTAKDWTVAFVDSGTTTCTFSGYVKTKVDVKAADGLKGSCTIKPTTRLTWS